MGVGINGLQFVERRISMDSSKSRNTFFYVRNPNLGSKRSKSRGIMDRIGPERVFWLSCTSFCNFSHILGGNANFFTTFSNNRVGNDYLLQTNAI